MKFFRLMLIFALCLALVIPAYGASESEAAKKDYLVQFDGPAAKGLMQAFGVADAQILHEFELLPVVHVELTEKQYHGLLRNPQVKAIEENHEVKALAQSTPWGITRVEGTAAHNRGFYGNGIKVAVLDTGIDRTHEDLNVRGGYSVFTDSANRDPYYDGSGHGTHVAGTVAALNNTVGVIGVAPQAELYAVKVLNNSGSGSYAGIAQGIEWAIQNNMDIINMSLGGSQSSNILRDWCDLAYNSGILVVAAAGNSGNSFGWGNTVGYPARYDSVIAVAATDSNNRRASFSSHGPAVELAAPGVNILSTTPGNNYASYNGTSMASPHVAGVAALVWAEKPNLTNVELRQLLRDTAQNLGSSNYFGSGLVRAVQAIDR